jgi:hypothetical protein
MLMLLGMKHSSPVAQLRAFLSDPEHPERTRTWLADILGISQAAVSQWLATDRKARKRPGESHRAILEQLCGIPASAWLKAEERAEERDRELRLRAVLAATGTDGR